MYGNIYISLNGQHILSDYYDLDIKLALSIENEGDVFISKFLSVVIEFSISIIFVNKKITRSSF